MLKKYIEDYLSVNLADYPNINIDFEISKFLLIALCVLIVSFFIVNWHKGYMSYAIKQLFRHEAFSEDSAKTLAELGLDRSRPIKRSLSSDTRLSRIIRRVGQKEYTYEEYVKLTKEKKKTPIDSPDFESDKFFIKAEKMDEAKNIYENYNASVPKTIAFSVMLAIIFIGLTFAMPTLLLLINELLG